MINFEKELNKEQLKVVYEGDGPCLVLSGPGSGKTRTLVYRAAYLLEKGVLPSQILLLTFTKKAAKEMLSRIYSLSSFNEKEICGGTFHHVGNLFLRKYAENIGYFSNFVILDEEDSRNIIKEILKERKRIELPKPSVVQKIISLSINSKKPIKKIIEKYFFYFSEEISEELAKIGKVYEERKKKNNLMDFDDLLLNWNEILSIKKIREEISNKFLYLLIDEYQDTNVLQDEIIKKISEKHNNVLAVGDDSQSIYSFRAADINNIINFSKNYPRARVFKLETNYRSTPEILHIANSVIKNNQKKLEKELFSIKKTGPSPIIIPFSNSLEQARYIANYLKGQRDRLKTAVLFRAHYQAVELEIELAKKRVPYILRGGIRFFEQYHVKDVIAFLRIYLNFFDESSWKRILLRQEGIGEINSKKVIDKVLQLRSIDQLLDHRGKIIDLFSSQNVKKGINIVLDLLEKGSDSTIPGKINLFLKNFYHHYLDFSFENSRERKNDLKRILEISSRYENLEEMIADFSLSEDFQKEENNKNAVVLSTIHQAKGLEWETVFVISLKEGSFPHSKSVEDDLLEEERRLFYVAVTRCKENLFLTYPLYDFREKEIAKPSRFLEESGFLEKRGESFFDDEEIIESEEEWEIF
jgi:DNA helicase II / ATP-dependent DNA helicase PcrA